VSSALRQRTSRLGFDVAFAFSDRRITLDHGGHPLLKPLWCLNSSEGSLVRPKIKLAFSPLVRSPRILIQKTLLKPYTYKVSSRNQLQLSYDTPVLAKKQRACSRLLAISLLGLSSQLSKSLSLPMLLVFNYGDFGPALREQSLILVDSRLNVPITRSRAITAITCDPWL